MRAGLDLSRALALNYAVLTLGEVWNMDDDRNFNPMIYDALRELETRIGGRYVYWQNSAKSEAEAEHWQDEHLRLTRDVRAVDPWSRAAIEAKRAELSEFFASMPLEAPEFTG